MVFGQRLDDVDRMDFVRQKVVVGQAHVPVFPAWPQLTPRPLSLRVLARCGVVLSPFLLDMVGQNGNPVKVKYLWTS